MLEVGMGVDVSSQLVSGPGMIVDISGAEYFSVQVELDTPDVDGHRLYRFHPAEIKKQVNKQVAVEEHTVEVIKHISGYGLKVGECFTARPTKPNKGTHYYIYNEDKLRGCFPRSCFRTITVTDIAQHIDKPKQEKEIKEKVFPQQEHQTSIFEFI